MSIGLHMKKLREANSERVSMCFWSRRAGFYGYRVDKLLVVLGLQDLATAIKPIRTDMVTQMRLARGRLDGQRWRCQKVMRTMHAALGRGFFVLLDSHGLLLIRLVQNFNIG